MVNFDSTVNTPAVASYFVNQKDRERGLRERLRGIGIGFCLQDFPNIQALRKEQQLCLVNLARGKDIFAILLTGIGKSLILQLFPRLAKAAMKSEMCSIVVVSPLVSVMRDQVDSAKNTGKTRKR